MTAEEARQMTNQALASEVIKYNVDFECIFRIIDYDIEEAAKTGKNKCYVTVDGCDESWECVYYKRDKIIDHFTELGYSVESHGYDRCTTSDCFTISW